MDPMGFPKVGYVSSLERKDFFETLSTVQTAMNLPKGVASGFHSSPQNFLCRTKSIQKLQLVVVNVGYCLGTTVWKIDMEPNN